MPRWGSRLIAVVTLLAYFIANGHGIGHARLSLQGCPCTADCHDEAPPADPDHDDDSSGSSCPCPGGCALCSVAKVPCLLPLTALVEVASGLDDGLDEASPVYDSPFCATLTPPPRP
jgi:hypothetical protein